MASRSASSSLRRRLLWTLTVIGMIALVSIGTIVLERAPKETQPQPAAAVAGGDQPGAADGGDAGKVQLAQHIEPVDEPPGPKPAGDFFSPRFGYGVGLSGTAWTRWENLGAIVPEAEWGALLGQTGRFLVIPVWLADLEPRQEALDHALLARLGIAYPSDAMMDFRPVEHERAAGHGFRLIREVSGVEHTYHLWVLRRGACGYLAAAWVQRSAAAGETPDEGALDDVLGRITFDESLPAGVDAEQFGPQQRQAHGMVYNDLGKFAYDSRDFAGATRSFARAIELRSNDPAILGNLVNAHIELKQHAQALEQIEQRIGRFADQPDLWAGRAYLLSELGQTDAAIDAYAALFTGGYREEGPFSRYVDVLVKQDRGADALAAVEQFLQSKESFAVRRMQAALYRQRGEHERAIVILTTLEQGRPFSAELAYELADSLCGVQQFHEALDVCRELVANRYETAHTFLLQARSQYGLKWYTEAKTSLEAALAREPANEEAHELLALVGAMLGEGNNAAVREPIEPVAWPEALAATKPAAADEAELRQYGAYLLRRHMAIEFEAGKQFKVTQRQTIQIADASGVARFSTIQVPLDPVGERLYVNSLRVLDAKGAEVAASKPSDYYVVDGAQAKAPTHAKLLNIPVPGLQPGCTIELVLTRSDVAPPAEFPYTAHTFSSDVPVLSAMLYVRADEGALRLNASPDVRAQGVEGGLAWRSDDPPVYRWEPLGQPREAFLPRVVIVSRSAQWEKLANEYLESIEDRLQPDAAERALAGQIAAGAADDEARVAAVVRYVQDTLTYKPIEFGRRARVPGGGEEILRNKYGDCKDHSLLTVLLLRACGIEANLVLANLDAPIDPRFPALEQFNHMLVQVPGKGGGRFVDCTDKDSDLLSLEAPLDLGGKRVFVLDRREPRFAELPTYEPLSSRIRVARQVRLMNLTDAAVEETVTVEGHHAAFLRGLFKPVPAANRAAMLQGELSPFADAMQMQSLEIENLTERGKPLVFKATYTVGNRFQPTEGAVVGQLPALWERMYLGVQPVPDRRTPFEIEYPLEFTSVINFIVPEEYQAEVAGRADTQGQSSFATWTIQTAPTQHGVQLNYELHLPAGRFPAGDYAAYHDELERAVSALGQQVVLKKRR